jgi:predicted Zn-dependent protease
LELDLGRALLSGNQTAGDHAAVTTLTPLARFLGDDPLYWRQLAIARGRTGDDALAALALAEAAIRRYQLDDAQRFAQRAVRQLKTGSPAWLRANDIAAQVAQRLKKR